MPAETVSDNVETLINLALAEDFGSGDVTSTYFVPEHLTTRSFPQGGSHPEGGSLPA